MIRYKQDFIIDLPVTIVTVENDSLRVKLMDYGATLLQVSMKMQDGWKDLCLEYEDLDSYDQNALFMGAIVGPTAGRTKNASFIIDGKETKLDVNYMNLENLHGGKDAFSYKKFHYAATLVDDGVSVEFELHDIDSLYPGKQDIVVRYTINETDVKIEYLAHTSEPTILNLTNHAYFNFDQPNLISEHVVNIHASKTALLDEHFVPISLIDVPDSMRVHQPIKVGELITKRSMEPEKGIDNPFLLDQQHPILPQAKLSSSEVELEVFTTYPVIVCYTHNHSDGELLKNFHKHPKHAGICFEAQFMPNGHNVKGVFDAILMPTDTYKQETIYRFIRKY